MAATWGRVKWSNVLDGEMEKVRGFCRLSGLELWIRKFIIIERHVDICRAFSIYILSIDKIQSYRKPANFFSPGTLADRGCWIFPPVHL